MQIGVETVCEAQERQTRSSCKMPAVRYGRDESTRLPNSDRPSKVIAFLLAADDARVAVDYVGSGGVECVLAV